MLLLFGMRRGAAGGRIAPVRLRARGTSTFIVALLVFALGAGVSLYEGVQHILKPEPIQRPIVNYVVLLAAMVP